MKRLIERERERNFKVLAWTYSRPLISLKACNSNSKMTRVHMIFHDLLIFIVYMIICMFACMQQFLWNTRKFWQLLPVGWDNLYQCRFNEKSVPWSSIAALACTAKSWSWRKNTYLQWQDIISQRHRTVGLHVATAYSWCSHSCVCCLLDSLRTFDMHEMTADNLRTSDCLLS